MSSESEQFPWHLGLHDAHCHPLERPGTFNALSTMKTRSLGVMATRREDQPILDKFCKEQDGPVTNFSHDTKVVPGFGWHPWFSHLLYDDTIAPVPNGQTRITDEDARASHFAAVLSPAADREFALALELPTPLSVALAELRANLEAHPLAMVGEVGLDKAFRLPEPWTPEEEDRQRERDPGRTPGGRCRRKLSAHRVAIAHQKVVLLAQLRVAGEFGRAVSVHGVQVHGALFEVFKELWKGYEVQKASKKQRKEALVEQLKETSSENRKPFPPRICLHSFSGTVDALKPYFATHVPSDNYVSFAWLNNFRGSDSASTRVEEVIKWVPESRILIESDLHEVSDESDELLERMARTVCDLRGWSLEDGVQILGRNWWRFVAGKEEGWDNGQTEAKTLSDGKNT
jgi:Tat protein secretion system quality control protein TatD with DNase activity